MRAITDGVFLTRPILWVPVWGFAVFGAARGMIAQGTPGRSIAPALFSVSQWGMLALLGCSVGAVYVLNQLFDTEADRRNPGFALMAHGGISPLIGWITLACLGIGPVAIAAGIGQPVLLTFCLATLLLGAAYCIPPLRFSGRPYLDFLSNAAGYGVVAFGCGWWLSGAGNPAAALREALPYVLLMCGGSISSTITDIEGDRAGGKRTTAVKLGPLTAHRLACACIVCATLLAYIRGDMAALLCGGCALPFYAIHELRRSRGSLEASYKASGAVMMLVAALREPVLAMLGLGILGATMIYFRLRFNICYPSLMPAGHAVTAP